MMPKRGLTEGEWWLPLCDVAGNVASTEKLEDDIFAEISLQLLLLVESRSRYKILIPPGDIRLTDTEQGKGNKSIRSRILDYLEFVKYNKASTSDARTHKILATGYVSGLSPRTPVKVAWGSTVNSEDRYEGKVNLVIKLQIRKAAFTSVFQRLQQRKPSLTVDLKLDTLSLFHDFKYRKILQMLSIPIRYTLFDSQVVERESKENVGLSSLLSQSETLVSLEHVATLALHSWLNYVNGLQDEHTREILKDFNEEIKDCVKSSSLDWYQVSRIGEALEQIVTKGQPTGCSKEFHQRFKLIALAIEVLLFARVFTKARKSMAAAVRSDSDSKFAWVKQLATSAAYCLNRDAITLCKVTYSLLVLQESHDGNIIDE